MGMELNATATDRPKAADGGAQMEDVYVGISAKNVKRHLEELRKDL